MKTVVAIVAVLIGLLSMAAGAAKIALVPTEVEFLRQFGFGNALTISFGVAQALGGFLLALPATRLYGSLIAAAGFALSAVLLLIAGDAAFASVSLLPVLVAGFVSYHTFPRQLPTEAGRNHP